MTSFQISKEESANIAITWDLCPSANADKDVQSLVEEIWNPWAWIPSVDMQHGLASPLFES